MKFIFITLLSLVTYVLFMLGNYIYATNAILIIKVLVSEACFILIYTLVDKGNLRYKKLFAIINVLIIVQFYTPFYSDFFYSRNTQIFSVSIFITTIIINYLVVTRLVSKGLTKLLSSRISSSCASLVEICTFAYLLDIGIKGALTTAGIRIVYILIFSKLVFFSEKKQTTTTSL